MSRVVGDIYDSLEVIENLTTPPRARHIREANYTEKKLEDNEYPSPISPKGTANLNVWNVECQKWQAAFSRNNVKQEELFWHPAGAAQFGGSQDDIDRAQRVKVRLTVDTKVGWLHFLGIYAPPGEVITVEVPSQLAGFEIRFNVQAVDWAGDGWRLPDLKSGKFVLKQGLNYIGTPIGGCITWEINVDHVPEPVDVYISGGILTPWFRYGVDTDEDWTNRIRHYPGLVACVDTGNLFMIVPSSQLRGYTNLSLPLAFYRACCEIMDSAVWRATNNPVSWLAWYWRRSNGRPKETNRWYFDIFIGQGIAYGAYGSNYCVLPYARWFGKFDVLTFHPTEWMMDAWGTLHELGHHHQIGWYFPQGAALGEVTNNVLVLLCYSYYSKVSFYRTVDQNGGMSLPGGGGGFNHITHGYQCIQATGSDNYLQLWVSLLHAFGQTKFRRFLNEFAHGSSNPQGTYGMNPAYAVVGAQVFGLDIRTHLRFMGLNIDDPTAYPNQKASQYLNETNLKPWYPIINAYQTGYEIDGEVFETARPLRIPLTGTPYRFNFKAATRQRPGQGNFVIKELKPGRGRWVKIEEGVYDYTAPDDLRNGDEWRLVYYETTTQQTTISYGTIRFVVHGNEFRRFSLTGNVPGNSVMEAYRMSRSLTPSATGTGSGMKIADHSQNKYVTVCKGSLIAPKTGNYTFYAAPDERALLYFSKAPLVGDPDRDAKYLTLIDDTNYHEYDPNKRSDWHMLTEGQQYYFCFVIYNTDGVGGGKIGYTVNNTGKIVDFPEDKVFFESVNGAYASEVDEDWMPETFEELQGLDAYYGDMYSKPVVSKVTAPTEQEGRSVNNLIDGKKGDDNNIYVTRWNPSNEPAPYPQVFEFELQGMPAFDILQLRRCKEARRVITENLTIKCDNEVVYSGPYDSHGEGSTDDWRIPYPYMLNCSRVQLSFSDNSARWDDLDLVPGVCLQEVEFDSWFSPNKVVPISHPSFVFKNNWTKSRGGSHYNGFSMYGSAGATLEFKLNSSVTEFVILGDKWVGSGSDVASVWINGKHSGNIMPNVASSSWGRLYKKPLFIMRHMNMGEDITVKVQVESGEIGISGLLFINDQKPYAIVPLTAESNAKLASLEQQDSPHAVTKDSQLGPQLGIAIGCLCVVALTVVGAVSLRRRLTHNNVEDLV